MFFGSSTDDLRRKFPVAKSREIHAQDRFCGRCHDTRGLEGSSEIVSTTFLAAGSRATTGKSNASGPLHVWIAEPAVSGEQALIETFERSQPSKEGVLTRYIDTNDGNLKVDTALEDGSDIDASFTYSVKPLAQRSSSGIMADLVERLRADERITGYLGHAITKSFRVACKVRALAASRSPLITIVNDALCEKVSFDLPQEWDLTELRQNSKNMSKVAAVSGGVAIVDIARIALGPNHWYTKSGNLKFSDAPFRNWLRTGHEMIRTGASYPWTEVLSRHLSAYQQDRLLSQDFGFWTSQPCVLRCLHESVNNPQDFTVSHAALPRVQSATNWNNDSHDDFMAVSEKSQRQELAGEFLSLLATEGARLILSGGRLAALEGLADSGTIVSGMLGKDIEKHFDRDSFRRVAVEKPPRLVIDSNLTAHNERALVSGKVHPFPEPSIARSPRYLQSARYICGTRHIPYAPVLCGTTSRIRRRSLRMGDFSSNLFPDDRARSQRYGYPLVRLVVERP